MSSIQAMKEAVAMGHLVVDPHGHVWSMVFVKKKSAIPRLKPKRAEVRLKSGYLGVHHRHMGKQYLVLAHRLVWTVLRGDIPEKMDINHIDGNKANNSPDNLDVVTRSENIRHAYATGLRERTDMALDMSVQAAVLRKSGKSFSQIAKALGVSQTTAFRAVRASTPF